MRLLKVLGVIIGFAIYANVYAGGTIEYKYTGDAERGTNPIFSIGEDLKFDVKYTEPDDINSVIGHTWTFTGIKGTHTGSGDTVSIKVDGSTAGDFTITAKVSGLASMNGDDGNEFTFDLTNPEEGTTDHSIQIVEVDKLKLIKDSFSLDSDDYPLLYTGEPTLGASDPDPSIGGTGLDVDMQATPNPTVEHDKLPSGWTLTGSGDLTYTADATKPKFKGTITTKTRQQGSCTVTAKCGSSTKTMEIKKFKLGWGKIGDIVGEDTLYAYKSSGNNKTFKFFAQVDGINDSDGDYSWEITGPAASKVSFSTENDGKDCLLTPQSYTQVSSNSSDYFTLTAKFTGNVKGLPTVQRRKMKLWIKTCGKIKQSGWNFIKPTSLTRYWIVEYYLKDNWGNTMPAQAVKGLVAKESWNPALWGGALPTFGNATLNSNYWKDSIGGIITIIQNDDTGVQTITVDNAHLSNTNSVSTDFVNEKITYTPGF